MSPEEANRTELTKSQKQPTRLSRKMNLKEPKRAKHSKKTEKIRKGQTNEPRRANK